MNVNRNTLFESLQNIISGTDKYIEQLAAEIDIAKRIFIIGMGRSGLAGRMFAMRLFHLGKESHMVWDTCTPPIREGDLLIAISKSGKTTSVINVIEKAAELSANIILVTSTLEPLVDLPLNHLMFIDVSEGKYDSSQFPMGTLFEISTLIYFDLIIAEIISQKKLEESFLQNKHANLE